MWHPELYAGRAQVYLVQRSHEVLANDNLSKVPITAVDMLNERVVPFYEEHGLQIDHLLTDNGREYCGRELHHPFGLVLAINQIEHRKTKVRSPERNGFCERFHRTLNEQFFLVAFRRTFYESIDQLQLDLDRYLEFYNREQCHSGYRTKGRTPYRAFLEGAEQDSQAANA